MHSSRNFVQQTNYSAPLDKAHLFDAIPPDIVSIVRVVQGLLVHYLIDGYTPAPERLCEIDTRYVSAMLERITTLDNRPLTEARSTEKRLVGCCRDYALLTVAILRHKGIPARVRYGTGAYFFDNFYSDHAILEYWNGSRWVAVDAQMSPEHIQRMNIQFDVFDVPDNQFIRGGQAWLMVRQNGMNPDLFGIAPAVPVRGIPIIVTQLALELASLNGVELLCWDSWGLAGNISTMTDADKKLLDEVATATLDDKQPDKWADYYRNAHFRVPDTIRSFTPALKRQEQPAIVHLNS